MTIRRLARHFLALIVVLGATAGGVALADVVVGGVPTDERAAPDPTPVPGSQSIEAYAPDRQGGPAWAVRVYALRSGQLCADFGREVRGELGLIDGNGAFHARRPADAGGNCGDPDAALGLILSASFYPDDPTTSAYEPPRTIIHGVAGSHVTGVEVGWPSGGEPLRLSRRRAFISVYDGAVSHLPVTVSYDDGSQVTPELKLPTGQ
jgi:hypothetical protein